MDQPTPWVPDDEPPPSLSVSDVLDVDSERHKAVRRRLERLFDREKKKNISDLQISEVTLQFNGSASRYSSHDPDDFFVVMDAMDLDYDALEKAIVNHSIDS